jgi:DNA-binding NtrC family response regulator
MSLRLLVVDDDVATLLALSDALRLNISDATVAVASSAEEALRVLTSEPIDVVLSDVRMPGMSGLDLLREVKTRQPECIVFLITAYDGARQDALNLGATQFLEKPIDIKQLAMLLKQAGEQTKMLNAVRERNRLSHPPQ